MAAKEGSEKFFGLMNIVSIGLLTVAIITANNVLAMGSAFDIAGNIAGKDIWERITGKKKS